MSLMLPVLQYGEDERANDKATTDTVIERHVDATAPQQPSTRSTSSSNSSKLASAGKPAAAKARKATTKQQQGRKDEGQSDVSSRPDVLQALTKERKRRAFIGMLKLLEHGAKDMSQLQLLVTPMSDEELLQVAQERALAGKCGNPLCSKPYKPEMASTKYRMSAGELHLSSAPLDSHCYCSKSCSSFTQQLAAQLVNPMERLKPSVLQKALQGPSHKPQLQQQGVGAQGGGVTTMKAVIEERPAYQLIHEAESAGRALDEAAAAVGGDSTAAAAVEGYIPRQAPNTQPKQQQQQQSSASMSADAPEDVLQLQPVLHKLPKQQHQREQQTGASNSNEQPSAAAVVSNPQQSADDLQQYLKVFREHQEQKLQQIQQKQPNAPMDSSSSSQQHATVSCQHQQTLQQQQSEEQQNDQQRRDRQQGGPQKQRRVRFAPDVAFTCPAEPAQHHQQQQQEQQQPVLTFTFTQGDSSSSSRDGTAGASCGGLVGELQLTTVDDSHPNRHSAAAAGAVIDEDNPSDQQQQEMPEAWKLFLPPALGGVGVPVKQVVVGANGINKGHKKQQHKPQQQVEQQQHGADATTSSSRSSNGAASSVASGTASQAAVSAAGTSSAEAAAPAAAAPGAAAVISTGSGKPRKFSPLVRPRRSVVVLDEVPGVVLQQRGVRPGARPAAAAADGVDGASSAAAVSEPAAAAAAAADRQTTAAQAPSAPQQQQQVASSSSATPSAASYGNTLRSSNSRNKKNQVVRIGPLRDQGSSGGTGGQSNGIPSTAQHNPENDNHNETDSEGDMSELSDMSDQEQWYYEDAGGSSSKGNARHQDSSSSSKHAAAGDGGIWDNDGSESEGEGQSENGDGLKDGQGSDNEGGVGLGAEGLTEQAAKEALDSLMPFFDTKGITVTLSEFGLVWNQLHAWVSPATVAYVGDRQAGTGSSGGGGDGGVSSSSSNCVGAGIAAAAAEQGTSSMAVIQQRIALTNLLMAAAPSVTQQLGIAVPEAQISKHISALVRSFYMPGPLPALQARHWQLLVTLMLGALSAWQFPVLRPVFKRGQAGGSVLSVLLQQLGSDVDRFWALMDLFELEV